MLLSSDSDLNGLDLGDFHGRKRLWPAASPGKTGEVECKGIRRGKKARVNNMVVLFRDRLVGNSSD